MLIFNHNIPKDPVPVVTTYSFDPEVTVVLCGSQEEAEKYLETAYEEEMRIESEENGLDPEGELDLESGSAKITVLSRITGEPDIMEIRIGTLYQSKNCVPLKRELIARLEEICGDDSESSMSFAAIKNVDEYVPYILEHGFVLENGAEGSAGRNTVMACKVMNLMMRENDCHRDCCEALRKYPECVIMTGYACVDGCWYEHSWLYDGEKRIILEPWISPTPEIYYGAVLSGNLLKQFLTDNGGR